MADALLLPVGMPWPQSAGAAVAFGNFSLNGATDQMEFIFQMPEAAVLTQGWVRLNAVTGASPVYRLSLQGVDTSGFPDGTIKGGGTPASKTFTPSGSGTIQKVTFDNSYSAARGELLALVQDYSSGTIDASNLASMSSSQTSAASDFPYAIQNDAGSRAKQAFIPVFGVASASKAYGYPILAAAGQTINSGATAEFGAKFALPAGLGSTYKVAGARFYGGSLTAAKALAIKLYQGGDVGDTTVLQDVSWDSDYNSAVLTALSSVVYFDEASLTALNFGDTYRIGISTSDASNQNFQGFTVAAAADLDAFPLGQQFTLSTRSGGNWTDTATTRMFVELILADITPPAGGASGVGGDHGLIIQARQMISY